MFDFLGTIVDIQWQGVSRSTGFQQFLNQALKDISERIKHLTQEVSRIEKFILKIQRADTFLGGTSRTGNPDAIFSREDKDTREQTNVTGLHPITQYLIQTKASLKETTVDNGEGNIAGGDLPWLDVPLTIQQAGAGLQRAGTLNDAQTAVLIEELKSPMVADIQRRRENLEFKLKSALDRREQLLLSIYDLTQLQTNASQLIGKITAQFGAAQRFSEQLKQLQSQTGDEDAENVTTITEGDIEKRDKKQEGSKNSAGTESVFDTAEDRSPITPFNLYLRTDLIAGIRITPSVNMTNTFAANMRGMKEGQSSFGFDFLIELEKKAQEAATAIDQLLGT